MKSKTGSWKDGLTPEQVDAATNIMLSCGVRTKTTRNKYMQLVDASGWYVYKHGTTCPARLLELRFRPDGTSTKRQIRWRIEKNGTVEPLT